MPRSEAMVKRCLGALFSEPALEALSFLDRTERERFLTTLTSFRKAGESFFDSTSRGEEQAGGGEGFSHGCDPVLFHSILGFDGLLVPRGSCPIVNGRKTFVVVGWSLAVDNPLDPWADVILP